jgi:hypothetical protein
MDLKPTILSVTFVVRRKESWKYRSGDGGLMLHAAPLGGLCTFLWWHLNLAYCLHLLYSPGSRFARVTLGGTRCGCVDVIPASTPDSCGNSAV